MSVTYCHGRHTRHSKCPSHKTFKISLRKGSFLENHKVSSRDFVLLLYLWSHEVSVTTASELVGVCDQTSVQWYSYFRDICSHHLLAYPIQIGGPDVIVQIDESVMTRRKYNQGRFIPERWVFGGIDTINYENWILTFRR